MKEYRNVILASASPRRQELLKKIFKDFSVIPSDADEIITKSLPSEIVMELAELKAASVADGRKDGLIIGSDTIVVLDGNILGKPDSKESAFAMLRSLAGRSHQVYTGVCLIKITEGCQERKAFFDVTDVVFYDMSDEEINEYIATGDPFDKAGAYGIQGPAGIYIKEIHGDYNNVVGLPVAKLYHQL